jgi:hypothetical protein
MFISPVIGDIKQGPSFNGSGIRGNEKTTRLVVFRRGKLATHSGICKLFKIISLSSCSSILYKCTDFLSCYNTVQIAWFVHVKNNDWQFVFHT